MKQRNYPKPKLKDLSKAEMACLSLIPDFWTPIRDIDTPEGSNLAIKLRKLVRHKLVDKQYQYSGSPGGSRVYRITEQGLIKLNKKRKTDE